MGLFFSVFLKWRMVCGRRLFFVVFCPIAGLRRSIVKLKIVGTTSFLTTSWRSFKEGPNKPLTTRFCSKLSSVKCYTQRRECFEGMKHSLFIFKSHSLLSFGSWGSLKVLTFDFEWFSSEVHCVLETVSNFPAFLELTNSDFTSFISDNYRTIFLTALRLWR